LNDDPQFGDYSPSAFLNLLMQPDKNNPNENYGRELLQLFLMGEYFPGESKEAGSPRSYSELDVAAISRILTGFRSDKNVGSNINDPSE